MYRYRRTLSGGMPKRTVVDLTKDDSPPPQDHVPGRRREAVDLTGEPDSPPRSRARPAAAPAARTHAHEGAAAPAARTPAAPAVALAAAAPADATSLRAFIDLNPNVDIAAFQARVLELSNDLTLSKEARRLAIALYTAAIAGEPGVTDPRRVAQAWSAEKVSAEMMRELQVNNSALHDWFQRVRDDVAKAVHAGNAFGGDDTRWWRVDDVERARRAQMSAAAAARAAREQWEKIQAEIQENFLRDQARKQQSFRDTVDREREGKCERDFLPGLQRQTAGAPGAGAAAFSETTMPTCEQLAEYDGEMSAYRGGILRWYADVFRPLHGDLDTAKYRQLMLACHVDKLRAQPDVAHRASTFLTSLRDELNDST
jgi:hypothetical protein